MNKRTYQGVWVVALAVLGLAGWSVAAERLPVAGDEGHVWVVSPGRVEGTIDVLHRGQSDPSHRLVDVETLSGELAAGDAAAAQGNYLFLAYRDGTVQVIRADSWEVEPGWQYFGGREAPLPGGALRAWGAAGGSPWAVVRMKPSEAPRAESFDPSYQMTPEDVERMVTLGLPPGVEMPGEEEEEDAKPQANVEAQDGVGPVSVEEEEARDYLVRLAGARWVVVGLPEGWAEPERAWVVTPGNGGGWPVLVGREGEVLSVYRRAGEAWERERYELSRLGVQGELAPLVVEGQLVLAGEVSGELSGAGEVSEAGEFPEVGLWLLREGVVTPIGVVEVAAPVGSAWGVAALGLTAAVVVQEPVQQEPATPKQTIGPFDELFASPEPLNMRWVRIDLTGTVVQKPQALERYHLGKWVQAADYLIVGAIGVLTVVMVVVLWRRDPAWNRVELPEDTVVADLMRRALAGAIDLAPAVIVVMRWYGLGLEELFNAHWPRAGAPLPSVVPGLMVIGLFVLHTTVSELVSGRSLGKSVTGLRVADTRGAKPKAWQVVVRGILKSADLVAPLLLLLPVIGPFRQRLGEVLARTVVVMPKPEGGDEEEDEDEEGGR